MAAGGGPPEKDDVKIDDFVKDSYKNRKLFGALRAHIVTFLNFTVCGRQFLLDWKFGPTVRF